MGISSVNKPDAKIEVVPDCEQRAGTPSVSATRNHTPDLSPEYFQEPTTVAQKRAANNQKVCRDQLSDQSLILALRTEDYGRDRQCQNGKGRPIYRLNIALCTIPDVYVCVNDVQQTSRVSQVSES